jgi:UDP-N-acetylmuramate dehydrogenase
MIASAEVDPDMNAVLRDEPMSRHTSWRVGGPADLYFKPGTISELREFLGSLPPGMPVYWVGYGSNLLVRDGGIRGAVVSTVNLERDITRLDPTRVRAGTGVSCARLARQCVRWGLGPAAFFAGIPGTIGGALAMNAGAFGGQTWVNVESVETIDRLGQVRVRPRSEFTIAYRTVQGLGEQWFTAATFAFEPDESADLGNIRMLLARRNASQPLGQASCGSVFRNPPGEFAGELIERCNLKGRRIGGAVVSTKHANFIVNDGAATADDIEQLISVVRDEVHRATGVQLETEVRVVGDHRKEAVRARS